MADKAILFDSSRCSACQACIAACKGRFGLASSASDSSSENETARAFGRAAVLDEEAPLAVARFERTLADGSTVWEPALAACTAPRRLARRCAPRGLWRSTGKRASSRWTRRVA